MDSAVVVEDFAVVEVFGKGDVVKSSSSNCTAYSLSLTSPVTGSGSCGCGFGSATVSSKTLKPKALPAVLICSVRLGPPVCSTGAISIVVVTGKELGPGSPQPAALQARTRKMYSVAAVRFCAKRVGAVVLKAIAVSQLTPSPVVVATLQS